MKTSHTAGPWLHDDSRDDGYFAIVPARDTSIPIALVESWDGDRNPILMAQAEANARLIAASPVLLRALEALTLEALAVLSGAVFARAKLEVRVRDAQAAIGAASGDPQAAYIGALLT